MDELKLYEQFPIIKKAIIELAYDNGCVNRLQSEARMLKSVYALIAKEDELLLKLYADEMARLSEEDFVEYLTGESESIKTTPYLDYFTLRVFEELGMIELGSTPTPLEQSGGKV